MASVDRRRKQIVVQGIAIIFLGAGMLLYTSPALANSDKFDWGTLNLSSEQSQQINQAEAEWKTTASEVIPQIQHDRAELLNLLNSPGGDQKKMMELQDRISSNKTKLQNAAMQSYLKKREHLNVDQQQQLQQMIIPVKH